jgi:transcriptional regulator with XRE-family HTH domain
MAKFKERENAISLRLSGLSISDIANKLSVSKSTVSLWCRDIALSESAVLQIAKTSNSKSTVALLRYTESLRLKRQQSTKDDFLVGSNKLGSLSERDIYCIGLGLYWGEGYKKGSQEFGFTNSDPCMINFYMEWLRVTFGVFPDNLILRVSINDSHAARLNKVVAFWVGVTGVSHDNFTKPSLIKSVSKKIYSNNDNHYGVLRIKVKKGTRMRRQLLGSIQSAGLMFGNNNNINI